MALRMGHPEFLLCRGGEKVEMWVQARASQTSHAQGSSGGLISSCSWDLPRDCSSAELWPENLCC